MNEIQKNKFNSILSGKKEIVTLDDLDAFERADMKNEISLPDNFVTIPNPNRCGILDIYVAFLKGGTK